MKIAEPEKTADNDVQSEEKIAVKVKNEKKTEKRTEKKNYSKKEKKTVKKSAKTDKKLLNSDTNSTKSSEKQNSHSSSKSEKPLNETYERKQTGQFYNNAFNSLLSFLSSKKKYLLRAKRLNQQGKCVILFKVDKTGRVGSAVLSEASSFSLLDRECQSLASKAVGFDTKVTGKDLNVSVPVSFKLNFR